MARDTAKADQLKAEGNKHFQGGNWVVAESFYSKAYVSRAHPASIKHTTHRAGSLGS